MFVYFAAEIVISNPVKFDDAAVFVFTLFLNITKTCQTVIASLGTCVLSNVHLIKIIYILTKKP